MKQSPIVNTHNQRLPGSGREEKRLAEVARMDSDTIGDLRRLRVTVLGAASITGNVSGTGNQLASLKSTCEEFNSRKRRNAILKTSLCWMDSEASSYWNSAQLRNSEVEGGH